MIASLRSLTCASYRRQGSAVRLRCARLRSFFLEPADCQGLAGPGLGKGRCKAAARHAYIATVASAPSSMLLPIPALSGRYVRLGGENLPAPFPRPAAGATSRRAMLLACVGPSKQPWAERHIHAPCKIQAHPVSRRLRQAGPLALQNLVFVQCRVLCCAVWRWRGRWRVSAESVCGAPFWGGKPAPRPSEAAVSRQPPIVTPATCTCAGRRGISPQQRHGWTQVIL